MIRAMNRVAQIYNLPYRRIVFGWASLFVKRLALSEPRRLTICDTAECHSALRRRDRRALHAMAVFISFFALSAEAHVGSPDVFYDGMVGPYSTRVTIRMPNVVPGRAEISVRVLTSDPVQVSFLPVYSWTPITNTPPPDVGRLVTGETNLYSGELWLMTFGAYSVEVHVKGPQGNGVAQIPVNSVAIRQLPLPAALGKILLLLAAVLVVGGIGIAAAAGREATLPAGATAETWERLKGILSATTITIVFVLALYFGRRWWNSEESAFRGHLRQGPWPDLATAVRAEGNERILQLDVGPKFFEHNQKAALIPDHGKLMHLFLVREGSRDAFAHLHPIKKKDYTFDVALPRLPEGRYDIFCDLTFEGGMSSTATNSIELPAIPANLDSGAETVERDPDDSWAAIAADAVPAADSGKPIFHLPDGGQVEWKCQKPLRTKQDASLRFAVTDSAGNPAELEPYMGMLCHAAVLRSDNAVFAHLHPSGNFSMAAQMFFADKMPSSDAGMGGMGSMGDMANMPGMEHMMHPMQSGGSTSEVYLPYEFPAPGSYRIWAQFKTGGRVVTAVFDAQVDP